MMIAKTAVQKNVLLNKGFYSMNEINEMLSTNEIFYFDENYDECYEELSYSEIKEKTFRIFTNSLNEIKVKLLDGYYQTVAVGLNGKEYVVEL